MTMRAAASDLPLVLDSVSLQANSTTILDRLNLTIGPGAPTLIVGPNGAGKTRLLRLCMGLDAPSAGRITWGGRADSEMRRRAILFQRPVMLRRTTAANLAGALAQFLQKSRVLDSDNCLGGEVLDQLNLLFGERPY